MILFAQRDEDVLSDGQLAGMTLGLVKAQVATLAIRMASVNGKGVGLFGLSTRLEERVTALAAKEVLLVIVPLAERRVVDRDKAGVDDWGFAVEAFLGKGLISEPTIDLHCGNRGDNMHDPGARTS